jgi:hypothetical protein
LLSAASEENTGNNTSKNIIFLKWKSEYTLSSESDALSQVIKPKTCCNCSL